MISTKARYALRVMIDLAQNQQDGYIPLKDIAARQDISEKYLEIILKALVKGKIIKGLTPHIIGVSPNIMLQIKLLHFKEINCFFQNLCLTFYICCLLCHEIDGCSQFFNGSSCLLCACCILL